MKLQQRASIKQTLRQKQSLNQKMIQMMKLFNRSYFDLVDDIKQETKDNVLLEVERDDQLLSHSFQSTRKNTSDDGYDVSDYAVDNSGQSLSDFLLKQLNFQHIDPKDKKIAEKLIENIDNRGFISNYDQVKKEISESLAVSERKIKDVLTIIQHFEPEGVGARNLKECLLIQVEQTDFENEEIRHLLIKLIKNHLDEIGSDNSNKLAEKLNISPEGVLALIQYIRENLNPNPGAPFSDASPEQYITPSFEVSADNDQIHLKNLEFEQGIKLTISNKYLQLLDDPKIDPETKAFLKDKYQRAKDLIENIENRRKNLEKLVTYIVNFQHLFIKKGPLYLEPLLQKDVAKKTDLSSSTVSRILSSKFIRTEWGTFALKQLCPRNHFGKTSERLKLLVIEIIKTNPGLSDQKLSIILKRDYHINIARRTVTKYRHLAGLNSNFLPKEERDQLSK